MLRADAVPKRSPRTISELSSSELDGCSLAPGITLPRLDAVLTAVGRRATLYVEIKAARIEPLVVRCIRESASDCVVHSFDHRIVRNVRALFPAIRCGVLEVARHIDPVTALLSTGAVDLWQHVDYIDQDLVARVHAAGGTVIAWTANDPLGWSRLKTIGVDAICTDRVGELAAFDW